MPIGVEPKKIPTSPMVLVKKSARKNTLLVISVPNGERRKKKKRAKNLEIIKQSCSCIEQGPEPALLC